MSYGNPYQNNPYGDAPSTEAGYGYGQVSALRAITLASCPHAPTTELPAALRAVLNGSESMRSSR